MREVSSRPKIKKSVKLSNPRMQFAHVAPRVSQFKGRQHLSISLKNCFRATKPWNDLGDQCCVDATPMLLYNVAQCCKWSRPPAKLSTPALYVKASFRVWYEQMRVKEREGEQVPLWTNRSDTHSRATDFNQKLGRE